MENDKAQNDMPCLKKCIQAVPSVLLIFLVVWVYYTFLVEFCLIELYNYPLRQKICLAIGNSFFFMFVWCYLHVMFCKTNFKIPNEFKLSEVKHNSLLNLAPSNQNDVLENYVRERHITLRLRSPNNVIRYCKKCHLIKPDRAHHCSTCEKCVMKMDHHCPWTNNCVGFANQKSFVLMLIYATLACSVYSIAVIEYYVDVGQIELNIHSGIIYSGFFLSSFLLLFMFILSGEHLVMIFRNETIIETLQDMNFMNPRLTFNLGPTQNFLEVTGTVCWKWWVPNQSTYGNGTYFEVRYKSINSSHMHGRNSILQ